MRNFVSKLLAPVLTFVMAVSLVPLNALAIDAAGDAYRSGIDGTHAPDDLVSPVLTFDDGQPPVAPAGNFHSRDFSSPTPTETKYTLTYEYLTPENAENILGSLAVGNIVAAPDAVAAPEQIESPSTFRIPLNSPYGTGSYADGYTFHGWYLKDGDRWLSSNQSGMIITNSPETVVYGYWTHTTPQPPETLMSNIEIFHFYVGGSTEDDQVRDAAAEAELPNGGTVSRDYNGITKNYVNGLNTLNYYQDDPATRNVEYRGHTLYAYGDNGEGGTTPLVWDGTTPLDLTGVKTLRIHLNYYQTRYNVTYNANGGVGADLTTRYNTAVGHTIWDNSGEGGPNFARTDYTFSGWSKDAPGTEKVSVGDVVPALGTGESVTYYAQWGYTPPGGGGDPGPSRYNVTVNYLEQGTSQVLAPPYVSPRLPLGSSYDVSAHTAIAIGGFSISSTDGNTAGTIRGAVTINVYFTANASIPDENPPLGPSPGDGETDIPGEAPPLAPLPGDGESGSGDDTVIGEENRPLGNLPQTGATAAPVNGALTLGLLALAAALSAAGLTVALMCKKEETI